MDILSEDYSDIYSLIQYLTNKISEIKKSHEIEDELKDFILQFYKKEISNFYLLYSEDSNIDIKYENDLKDSILEIIHILNSIKK